MTDTTTTPTAGVREAARRLLRDCQNSTPASGFFYAYEDMADVALVATFALDQAALVERLRTDMLVAVDALYEISIRPRSPENADTARNALAQLGSRALETAPAAPAVAGESAGHAFMGCQPGSCALPHPLPAPDESGCHWPYGNVFFGGSKPYRQGDPICMLTEAQHRDH